MSDNKRKNDSIVGEVIIGAVVAILFLLWSKGIASNRMIEFLIWILVLMIIVGVIYWLSSELIKSGNMKVSAITPGVREDERATLLHHTEVSQHSIMSQQLDVTETDIEFCQSNGWSEKLIGQLEWRVFEKLCIGLWQRRGVEVEQASADSGVDLYLYSAGAKKKKLGAVKCAGSSQHQIDVNVVRELQGVAVAEQLKLVLLMYSGKLSRATVAFVKNPAVQVRVQGNKNILKDLQKLDADAQMALFNELITGDHHIPSCPNCDEKMIEQTTRKNGYSFWECGNYNNCEHALQRTN